MAPSIKNYTKPRPVWMMVLGDTFLYVGNAAGFSALGMDAKLFAFISFGVGILGYFFTKLYKATEDEMIRQETITTEITTTVSKQASDVPKTQ